jgi:hypothetical protein
MIPGKENSLSKGSPDGRAGGMISEVVQQKECRIF